MRLCVNATPVSGMYEGAVYQYGMLLEYAMAALDLKYVDKALDACTRLSKINLPDAVKADLASCVQRAAFETQKLIEQIAAEE